MARAVTVIVALLLASCGGRAEGQRCGIDDPCTEAGEICDQGRCAPWVCDSSVDCPLEHLCEGSVCLAGCETSEDCYPGDVCELELRTCVPRGCVDTQADCDFGRICDEQVGECVDAGDLYCRPCTRAGVVEDCNAGDPGGTNRCWSGFCVVDCARDRSCPSGFECLPFLDEAGEVEAWQCVADCALHEPDSAQRRPSWVRPPVRERSVRPEGPRGPQTSGA
ncbi:MAG: hypothetical protein EA397_03065 [Deltaproteobacteria bacterium]|nr:MAG: hypothetical protein EA397_03065 [Deltaproteobacteria bacterium]